MDIVAYPRLEFLIPPPPRGTERSIWGHFEAIKTFLTGSPPALARGELAARPLTDEMKLSHKRVQMEKNIVEFAELIVSPGTAYQRACDVSTSAPIETKEQFIKRVHETPFSFETGAVLPMVLNEAIVSASRLPLASVSAPVPPARGSAGSIITDSVVGGENL